MKSNALLSRRSTGRCSWIGRAAPLLLFALASSPGTAAAEKDVEACFEAYEQTQVLLKADDLVNAATSAKHCTEGCPQEISLECKAWASQAKRETPTALFLPRNSDGTDSTDVSIELDGVAYEGEPGVETEVNPGPHEIIFRRDDGWEETVQIVAHKGEKARQIRVNVPPRESADPGPAPEAATSSTTPWAIAAFSMGGLGFGLAAYSGIAALNHRSTLDVCAKTPSGCEKSDLDLMKTYLLLGDVGLAVGAVGAITGASLLLWGSPATPNAPSASVSLGPTVGGGAGFISGRF